MELRRAAVLTTAGILAVGTAVIAGGPPAHSAACTGQVRYASSTNTLYLTSGSATLSDILRLCPAAPLEEVSASGKVWELDSKLVVENGATLRLHGSSADGDVNTLRLLSSSQPISITAEYGTIDINSVKITSWRNGGPDTDASGARPFIQAVSYLTSSGKPRESTMNIANSEIAYLGYNESERYGISYKARGCDDAHLSVCKALNVYGSQRNSRFHHNYMGTYTYNAHGMKFVGNEYDHNVTYGLDPHDDSDYLTVSDNHFHHNGDHGFICSKRCNNLVIKDNESNNNGVASFSKPGHGIMVHRGVTATVIENNNVHDQPNGAGIAVFDSSGIKIRNNTVSGARYGLLYYVGSHDVTTSGNKVRDSGLNAVYVYPGTDVVSHGEGSGRPSDLTFTGNTFDGAGGNIVRVVDSDKVTFSDNTFSGEANPILVRNSPGTKLSDNTIPASLSSSSSSRSTVKDAVAGAKHAS